MEGFNFERNNLLSAEEQETFNELFPITKDFFNHSENPEGAYERMKELIKTLKNPEKYFLWSLLSPDLSPNRSDYEFFDTEDGKIGNFIRSLNRAEVEELDFEKVA